MPFTFPTDTFTPPPASIVSRQTAMWSQVWGDITQQADLKAAFDQVQDALDAVGSSFDPADPGEIGGDTPAVATFTSLNATKLALSAEADDTPLAVSGYSITGSGTDPLLSLAGTLNTSGAPNVIDLNITNTASGAGARLLNLRVGGTTMLNVSPAGVLYIQEGTAQSNSRPFCIGGGGRTNGLRLYAFGSKWTWEGGDSTPYMSMAAINEGGCAFTSQISLSDNNPIGGGDVFMVRDAANTLALKNGANQQRFRTYNDTSGPVYAEMTCSASAAMLNGVGASAVYLALEGSPVVIVTSTGIQSTGTVTTAAGTAWDLGAAGTGSLSLDTANYLDAIVDGTPVKLALVNIA